MFSTRPTALPLDGDRRIITKTPGRALAKTRNVLQENAYRDVTMTVNAKGKKIVHNTPMPMKTLQTDLVLKDAPGKQAQSSKLKGTPLIRPLGDKTPFPNRIANRAAHPSDGSKVDTTLLDGNIRPTSTRKHDRLPRSVSKTFETPVTGGNHWDVSDVDIEVGEVAATQTFEQEDSDEIEYMPPKVEDALYEPPFELPNYREVGKTLMALIRSFPLDDTPPSVPLFSSVELEGVPDVLSLPSIESDDFFIETKTEVKESTKASQTLISSRKLQQKNASCNRTTTKTDASTVPTSRKFTATSTHRQPPTEPSRPGRSTSCLPSGRPPLPSRATRASSSLRSAQPFKSGSVAPSHTSTTSTRTTALTINKPSVTRNATGTMEGTVASRSWSSRPGMTSKSAHRSMSSLGNRTRNGVLETPKDLDGLIVFEDTWETEEFRFDV